MNHRKAFLATLAASALMWAAAPVAADTALDLPRCMSGGQIVDYSFLFKQDGRQLKNAELRRQRCRVSVVVDGTRTVGDLRSDAFVFPLNIPDRLGLVRVRVDTARGGGSWRPGVESKIDVVPVVHLRPPSAVDFGQVRAGCDVEEHCRQVDLSGSSGLWDGARLVVARPMTDANAYDAVELRVHDGRTFRDLPPKGEVSLALSGRRGFKVCVRPRRCSGLPDDSLTLALRIEHPCMGALRVSYCKRNLSCPTGVYGSAKVRLSASWVENSWWSCNRIWVFGAIGALLLAALGYGFIWPNRFHRNATLRVASKQRTLLRASAKPLRICPGGRPGLYRHAAVSISADGMTVKRKRGALLRLTAGRGSEIVVQCAGRLERLERSRWRDATDDADSRGRTAEVLHFNTPYRINGTIYFEVRS